MPRHRIRIADFTPTREMLDAVESVVKSGRLSYGPAHRAFEEAWAKEHNIQHAIFTASGTCALHLVIGAMKHLYGWKDGDGVIVPATTFPATVNAVLHNHLTPVFCDVEPHTFNLDPAKLEETASKHSGTIRAVIPVHLLGLPANMTDIGKVAYGKKWKIIEDSCEAVGVTWDYRVVGSIGHAGCFSTYMAHHVVTGVGGFVTTWDDELAKAVRKMMNHGRDETYLSIDDADGLKGDAFAKVVDSRFKFDMIGHSFRCTEMEAALGLPQVRRIRDIVEARRGLATKLTGMLLERNLGDVLQLPTTPEKAQHSWLFYGLVLMRGDRKKVLHSLESSGIETRDLFPLVNQTIYRRYITDTPAAAFPVASRLAENGFIVGIHQGLSGDDLRLIANAMAVAVEEGKK